VGELVQKIRFIVMKSKFARLEKFRHQTKEKDAEEEREEKPVSPQHMERKDVDVIAMGSSTGGVQAAVEIIPKLPAETKPIVWVQHMPPKFTKSFADRLDGLSAMNVVEAADGMAIENGRCYLAPGGFQMTVVKTGAKTRIRIGDSVKVNGHCPSCNVLFNSVAECYGQKALGVILTGMGDDGTEGLVNMHAKGALVIGQDERSCIVYGMPKAAFCKGAVDAQYPLSAIHSAIEKVIGLDQPGAL
jgi:two-component system chemotaxis response regulator CheB